MNSDAPSLGFGVPREEGVPGRKLLRRIQATLVVSLVAANVLGAVVVVALGFLVLPLPEVDDESAVRVANFIAAGAFLLFFIPVGSYWGLKRLRGARGWLREDREPTPEERKLVLLGPRRIVFVHIVIWGFGALFFGALNAIYSFEAGMRVATLVAFAGASVCAFVYLIAERQLRPAAARALAYGIGEKRLGPGIKTRVMIAWAMAIALPIIGLIIIGISTLVESDFTADELALVMIALGGSTLIVGFYALFLSARAIADPVVSLRRAVAEVEEGELDVSVPVYDGSEIGQLQSGFNNMVEGLRERERIHDLFGRHVGEDVAKAALESDIELGGETRDVSVLFVDMVGSTQLASERPPEEVVDTLNRFFAVVIEVVHEHGGWVNKFEGDAALAVFGAPVPLGDSRLEGPRRCTGAVRALRATRATSRPGSGSPPARWSQGTSARSSASSTR